MAQTIIIGGDNPVSVDFTSTGYPELSTSTGSTDNKLIYSYDSIDYAVEYNKTTLVMTSSGNTNLDSFMIKMGNVAVPRTIPSITSSSIVEAYPNVINLYFNTLTTINSSTGITFTVNTSTGLNILSYSGTNSAHLSFYIDRPIFEGEVVKLSYDSSESAIVNWRGDSMLDISSYIITNNTTTPNIQTINLYLTLMPFNTTIAQSFPSVESIVAKDPQTVPVYGLYNWTIYTTSAFGNYNVTLDTEEVGWKAVRMGGTYIGQGGMTYSHMTAIANSGYEVMAMLVPYQQERDRYTNDDDFIAAYLTYIDAMIGNYGPADLTETKGTYWINNPTVPYKPITYWELWNEPNYIYMYYQYWAMPPVATRATTYAKMVYAAYNHIKARWGDRVTVVGLASAGFTLGWNGNTAYPNNTNFIPSVFKDLYDLYGVGKAWDIISFHPYTPGGVGPDVTDTLSIDPGGSAQWWDSFSMNYARYLEYMTRYNGVVPLWISEVGWSKDNGVYNLGPAGHNRIVSELLQAAYICRSYLMCIRMGIERCHIMFALDTDGTNTGFFNPTHAHGVEGRWYKSAYAVKNMLSIMPNPKLVNCIIESDGYYAYTIKSNGLVSNSDNYIVIWYVRGPVNYSLTCDIGTYTITDSFGYTRTQINTTSSLSIYIGPFPTYIKKVS